MGKKLVIILLVFFAFVSFVDGASLSGDCSVKTSCSSGEIAIFSLSSSSNAHAAQSSSGYSYKVCCPGEGLEESTSCTDANAALWLSATTNAHVSENKITGSYGEKVCLSSDDSFSCAVKTSCSIDEYCIVSVYANSNSHVAECGGYGNDVCCAGDVVPTYDCVISGVEIDDSGCGTDGCGFGESVLMKATLSDDCSEATYFQIDAENGNCKIEYSGGIISGITAGPIDVPVSGTLDTQWDLSDDPLGTVCEGVTVIPTAARLWKSEPSSNPDDMISDSTDDIEGSVTFEKSSSCDLTSASFSPQCDPCGPEGVIDVDGIFSGDCSPTYLWISAIKDRCELEYGGKVEGVYAYKSTGWSSPINDEWELPDEIPIDCAGETVEANSALLTNEPGGSQLDSISNPTGSFTFVGNDDPDEFHSTCNTDGECVVVECRSPPCDNECSSDSECGGAGVYECNDGIDNDGDGQTDYPDDDGCDDASDDDETNCGDGVCEGGETEEKCPEDCGSTVEFVEFVNEGSCDFGCSPPSLIDSFKIEEGWIVYFDFAAQDSDSAPDYYEVTASSDYESGGISYVEVGQDPIGTGTIEGLLETIGEVPVHGLYGGRTDTIGVEVVGVGELGGYYHSTECTGCEDIGGEFGEQTCTEYVKNYATGEIEETIPLGEKSCMLPINVPFFSFFNVLGVLVLLIGFYALRRINQKD